MADGTRTKLETITAICTTKRLRLILKIALLVQRAAGNFAPRQLEGKHGILLMAGSGLLYVWSAKASQPEHTRGLMGSSAIEKWTTTFTIDIQGEVGHP